MKLVAKLVGGLGKASKFFKLINIIGESIDFFIKRYNETFPESLINEEDNNNNGGVVSVTDSVN